MKMLLVAINAKYIHSNLAVYSLREYAKRALPQYTAGDSPELAIKILTFTINQYLEDIREAVYQEHPDVVAFSCYIWNIAIVEELLADMEKLLPDADIWLGGPEVSWSVEHYLSRHGNIFGIMVGEGEKVFLNLCLYYLGKKALGDIKGIAYCGCRQGQEEPLPLGEVPFVYESLGEFEHKILYYETSRGCPFSCSYCLSSIEKKMRFRPIAMVERELAFFLEHRVPQVKFVDRTFNCNHEHAMAIWSYIKEHDNGVTNFHFEIAADLLREDEIALLKTMRPGLVQLEIGVQSTNLRTLKEIRRVTDLDMIRKNTAAIRENRNIHQHLDLIVGLPYEDFASFRRSFRDVYQMKPDQLQLGFLKILHGSFMEEKADSYGTVYSSRPPYEVLYTNWLSHDEVLRLKKVEEMVETYYNSGQFSSALDYMVDCFENPFDFYDELSDFYGRMVPREMKVSRQRRYEILLMFFREHFPEETETCRELLVFDYYLRENAKSRPPFAADLRKYRDELRHYYRLYPQGADVHVERFERIAPLLGAEAPAYVVFDYRKRNPLSHDADWTIG